MTRGLLHWIDARLPVVSAARREFRDYPMPPNLNGFWNFGAILTLSLLLMLATGLTLALTYVPNAGLAFASIQTIERGVPAGWLIRLAHQTGATLFMGALYLHIFRGLYYGSYKAPRELVWLTGMALLACAMVTAFAGYVLPWGQMSYWGADVITGAMAGLPVVGPTLSHLVLGDTHLGDVFLHRLFVVHFATAFAIVGIVVVHVACVHVAAPNDPDGRDPRSPRETVPFHPYFTAKDLFGLALAGGVFTALAAFAPGIVREAANLAPANPLRTPNDIVPAWYFLPFYGLLQIVPSKTLGLFASLAAIVLPGLMPWLDRSPIRSARHRPGFRIGMILMAAGFVTLGLAGAHHLQGLWGIAGRIAALAYFGVFVAVPFARRRPS